MASVFQECGLKYSLDGKTGNTLDSHRLALWAKKQGGLEKQDRLMTAMFDAYFCESKYLGDHEVLASAAELAGLPVSEARALLEDQSACKQEVEEELMLARRYRVTGVPFFVLHPADGADGQPYGLSGAQPADTLVQVLEELGCQR
jgi:predicted DsbA family dithiol-disulfide isomerase